MKNNKKFSSIGIIGGDCADKKNKSIPVNVIRQFPERPGEWCKKRLIVFVCTDSEMQKLAND